MDAKKKKGGGTLASQISHLRERLTEPKINRAKELAENEPDVVRLAFKLIGKGSNGLTKTQQKFYAEMQSIDPSAAEQWKQKALAN